MARLVGGSSCGLSPPQPLSFGGDCASLVASLALRVGIATGVATVVLALVAAGLSRTAARMEEDRRARTLEALDMSRVGPLHEEGGNR